MTTTPPCPKCQSPLVSTYADPYGDFWECPRCAWDEPTGGKLSEPDLYDRDFYTWTQMQAAALAAGHLGELDLMNLAEEIESLGKRDRRGLRSAMEIILTHLLKWRYQPAYSTRSWEDSIAEHRRRARLTAEDSSSLRHQLPQLLPLAYGPARREAARQTHLPLATFPEACPWTLEQVLDDDFYPAAP